MGHIIGVNHICVSQTLRMTSLCSNSFLVILRFFYVLKRKASVCANEIDGRVFFFFRKEFRTLAECLTQGVKPLHRFFRIDQYFDCVIVSGERSTASQKHTIQNSR